VKHILFITTVYRIGERVHPIIPKLAETYKLSLLTLYQMHPGGKYLNWNGAYDPRKQFHTDYGKYFQDHWSGEVYTKGFLDMSQFDAVIQDDCRDRSGLNVLYQDAKRADIPVFGNQHGGNDFQPNTYPVTGVDSNFDKMFFFGQSELDYFKNYVDPSRYLLGGIPANDGLKEYGRTNKHILLITNFLGNNPNRRYRGYQFNGEFIDKIGLREIQKKFDRPVLVKIKARLHDAPSYEHDIEYVKDGLEKSGIDGEIVHDVLDDNKMVCDSICVIGAGSTLMYKPIQKGIPTVIIRGTGESDFFGNFPGILNFGEKDKIIYQLENQQRDTEYLEYIIRGSSDYTSTEKYVDEIKKLV